MIEVLKNIKTEKNRYYNHKHGWKFKGDGDLQMNNIFWFNNQTSLDKWSSNIWERFKEIIGTRANNMRSCNAMLLISCHQYQQHVIVQQEVANYKVITIPSSWCLAWVAKHQTGDIINESYNNYYSYHSWKPPRVTSLSLRSNAQLLITSLLLLDYVI